MLSISKFRKRYVLKLVFFNFAVKTRYVASDKRSTDGKQFSLCCARFNFVIKKAILAKQLVIVEDARMCQTKSRTKKFKKRFVAQLEIKNLKLL